MSLNIPPQPASYCLAAGLPRSSRPPRSPPVPAPPAAGAPHRPPLAAAGGSTAASAALDHRDPLRPARHIPDRRQGQDAVHVRRRTRRPQSTCSGQCVVFWPPVTDAATPTVSGDASMSDVGSIDPSRREQAGHLRRAPALLLQERHRRRRHQRPGQRHLRGQVVGPQTPRARRSKQPAPRPRAPSPASQAQQAPRPARPPRVAAGADIHTRAEQSRAPGSPIGLPGFVAVGRRLVRRPAGPGRAVRAEHPGRHHRLGRRRIHRRRRGVRPPAAGLAALLQAQSPPPAASTASSGRRPAGAWPWCRPASGSSATRSTSSTRRCRSSTTRCPP